jgi:hypothetical protein
LVTTATLGTTTGGALDVDATLPGEAGASVVLGRAVSGIEGGGVAAGCVVDGTDEGTDFGGMDPVGCTSVEVPPFPFGSYFCVREIFPCVSIVHAVSLFGSLTNSLPPLSTTSNSPATPVMGMVSIN